MRITQHDSAQGAKGYYDVSDYFAAGPEELKGTFLGKAAASLGLVGTVDKEKFERVIDNLHPTEDTPLRPRTRDNRVGWDIMLAAPKSWSITYGLTGDERLLQVFQESLQETFDLLEQDAMTRVNTAPGEMHHETTGSLAAASWIHLTSRPTPGHAPDPQVHGHIYTFNLTEDVKRNRFTAVDISDIYKDTGYFDAYFQSLLASKTKALGYQVERSKYGFEVSGISRSLIEKFSKRSKEVAAEGERTKEEFGLETLSAKAKGKLGARSRSKKSDCPLTAEELPANWHGQLNGDERQQIDRVKNQQPPAREARITATDAVRFAKEHSFEHQAVVRERHLKRDAMLFGIGDNAPSDIDRAFGQEAWLYEGKGGATLVTTHEIQREEQQILSFARNSRGSMLPINPNHQIQRDFLSNEQRNAVMGVLTSTDQVVAIRGAAGTGKTTATKEAVKAIEQTGMPVKVMAPTTKAAYEILAGDGFDATTIAAFLQDEETQKKYKNGVLWVDESGLIDSPTMLSLMNVAEQLNSRLVLVGDSKQHQPVGRGTPLKQVEHHAGIQPLEITKIRRQQGQYKSSVEALSRGEVIKGLDGLDELGYVHELDDRERYKQLATDYADALEQARGDKRKLLIIAPTHAERREVEKHVRTELRQRGEFDSDDVRLVTLHSRRLSKAERSDPLNYRPGDRVAFHAKGKGGIQSGDQLTVASIDANGKVLSTQGSEIPLSSAGAFDVFEARMANFAVGDLIRITRKRRQEPGRKRLNNGSCFEIKSIRDGKLKLDNGETINPNQWAFFENALTATSHASQGATVNRTFVAQSAMSLPASSPEQLYVSASRARHRVDVYVDHLDSLKSALLKQRPQLNAIDVGSTQQQAESPSGIELSGTFNRIKQIAHQYATKQLKRFHDWLPTSMQPEMAR